MPAADKVAVVPYTAIELAQLSDAQTKDLLELHGRVLQFQHRYATFSTACGLSALIASIGSFTYLVHDGHPTSAGIVLGASIISIVGKLIASRL